MSKEEVSRFLCELASDNELQRELVRLAEEHGFDFEVEELREFFLEAAASGISDEQLKEVSGGAAAAGTGGLQPSLDRYLKPGPR